MNSVFGTVYTFLQQHKILNTSGILVHGAMFIYYGDFYFFWPDRVALRSYLLFPLFSLKINLIISGHPKPTVSILFNNHLLRHGL